MHRFKSLLLSAVLCAAVPWSVTAAEAEKEAKVKSKKIDVADLPAPVKDGFAKKFPTGEITKVEQIGEEKPSYRIYFTKDGKEQHLKFDAEGTPLAHPKKGGGGQ